MLKAVLRQEALRRRSLCPAEEVKLRSQRICDLFFATFSLEGTRLLHLFLPIRRYKELDTWLLIDRLRREYPAVAIAVPVADLQQTSLSHCLLQPGTVLAENRWGISEPVGAVEVSPEVIDMVLLPLLAFDDQGNRVGYGKGFYDRFLAQCRPGVLKIGLSLEPPVRQITDPHPLDVSLDYAVTPEQVYSFSLK